MQYYTATEAGAYVREHPTNVRAKAAKGIIRGFKRGGKKSSWLFLKEDLDDYTQRNENAPRQEVLRHENKEIATCQKRSRSAFISGGKSGSTHSLSRTVPDEYAKALGLPIKSKP